MNTDKKSRLVTIVVGGLLMTLLVVSIAYAAVVNIDTFNAGKQDISTNSGTPIPHAASSVYTDTGDILGDYRNAEVDWISGNNNINLTVDSGAEPGSNALALSVGSGTVGVAKVTWDGNGDPDYFDPTGLGNVNLESSDPTNDGIYMQVLDCDHPANLKLTGYEDGSNYEELTMSIAGSSSVHRVDLFYPFASFSPTGSGADWGSLGALVFEISGAADLDVTVDYMESSNGGNIREYGDLPSSYGTLLDAYHVPNGLTLGYNLDAENGAHASSDAAGDDGSDYDDEDGVSLSTFYYSLNLGQVAVIVNGCPTTCYVNGWMDFNGDGDFNDTVGGNSASEHIINDSGQANGTPNIGFTIPDNMSDGYYYARFRICNSNVEGTSDCNDPGTTDSSTDNGEVEDYRWPLGPTAVTLSAFDAAWSGGDVLVTWETTMEVDTVGFNVWRSTTADGSYVQVNSGLIPAESLGGVLGGSYSFTDASVTPGTTYYYKLEEIEAGGASNWYGPTPTGGSSPTAVTLSAAATALAWWPVAAGVIAGGGLMAFVVLRKRRQHQ